MADRNSLPEGLLADVKNYLNITWDDAATDTKVSGLLLLFAIGLRAGRLWTARKDGLERVPKEEG